MASFPSIRIEGGLLAPDVLEKLLTADLPGQRPQDFGLASRRNLSDEIAAEPQQFVAVPILLDLVPPQKGAVGLTPNLFLFL